MTTHSVCHPGRPGAPGRRPARLALLRLLPQGEVERRALLLVGLDPGPGLQATRAAAGPAGRTRRPGPPRGRRRRASRRPHPWPTSSATSATISLDVLRGVRDVVRAQDAQRVHRLPPAGLELCRHVGLGPSQLGVARLMMLSSTSVTLATWCTPQPVEAQVAAQDVEGQVGPAVADVGQVVDGRATDVHRHLALGPQLERADGARCGVVEVQHPGTVTRSCRPPRPARPGSPRSPSLDGLEDRVGRRLGGRRAPTASTRRPPATRSSPSTPRRRRCRARCTWARSSATCRPTPSPATGACAGWKLFYPMGWDDNGLPTERRVQTYFGVPCDPSLPYDPDFVPARRAGQGGHPGQPAQLHRAVPPADRAGRAGLRGRCGAASGSRSTGARSYATIDDRSRPRQPAHVPAQPGPGRGLLVRGARRCGTSTTRRRWPRPRWRTGSGPGPTTGCASTTSRSRRRAPSCVAACVALVAHPDDERYAARFGTTVHTPLFGVEVPVAGPPPGRARQGVGHRHDLHLRRRHRRRLVARARPPDPLASSPAPGASPRRRPPACPTATAWRAIAGTHREAGPAGHGRAARRVGRPDRRAPAHHPSGEVLRAGRPPARDRDQPAVVHPQRRARRGAAPGAPRAGRRARLAPAVHEGPLRRLGERAQRRLAHQPAALLRRARSRSGTRSAPTASPTTTSADRARRGAACPSTRRPTCPRATRRGPARRAGRLRRRPRRHGHLGHLVAHPPDRLRVGGRPDALRRRPSRWTCAPRAPRSSAPGSSPRCCARTWSTTSCPGSDTTINGWILDPDRKKMSKSKGNVVTPMPLVEEFGSDAVRYWACNGRPGTDTAVDTGVMKIGRRLAIKILNASKFALGRLGDGPAPGVEAVHAPLDLALLAQLADVVTSGHGGLRGVRLRPGPGGHRDLLLVLLRRLRRAGQDAGLRRGRRRRRRLGPGHPGARPLGPAPPLRPVPPLRDRGGVELVAGGLGPPRPVARRRRDRRPCRGRPGRARGGGRGARRGAPREDGQQALHAGPGGAPDGDRSAGHAGRGGGGPPGHRRRRRGGRAGGARRATRSRWTCGWPTRPDPAGVRDRPAAATSAISSGVPLWAMRPCSMIAARSATPRAVSANCSTRTMVTPPAAMAATSS